MAQSLGKQFVSFLIKLNMHIPYDPTIHSWTFIPPREMRTYHHAQTGTQVFSVALFVRAKSWKEP